MLGSEDIAKAVLHSLGVPENDEGLAVLLDAFDTIAKRAEALVIRQHARAVSRSVHALDDDVRCTLCDNHVHWGLRLCNSHARTRKLIPNEPCVRCGGHGGFSCYAGCCKMHDVPCPGCGQLKKILEK